MSHPFRATFDACLSDFLRDTPYTRKTWYRQASYIIANYNMWEEASQFGADGVKWYIYTLSAFMQYRVRWGAHNFEMMITPLAKALCQTHTLSGYKCVERIVHTIHDTFHAAPYKMWKLNRDEYAVREVIQANNKRIHPVWEPWYEQEGMLLWLPKEMMEMTTELLNMPFTYEHVI